MDAISLAAATYALLTAFIVVFQIALAAGAPLGSYAMGGRFPGVLPPAMRIAALVQAAMLGALALVVLERARLWPMTKPLDGWLMWVVVGVAAVALVMNTITPSKGERMVWAPVALLMLASSLTVAFGA